MIGPQVLTTNLWLNLAWTDSNMRWNTSAYGNIESINIPPSKLWKPDVFMYNTADEAFDVTYPTNVVVNSEGQCTYIPPGIFKVRIMCKSIGSISQLET